MSVQRSPSPDGETGLPARTHTLVASLGDPAHITIAVPLRNTTTCRRTECDGRQAHRIGNLSEIRIRPADNR